MIANVDEKSNVEILTSLRKAVNMMSMQDKTNYWMSDEWQRELLRRIDIRAKKPSSGLSVLDYSPDTNAMLSSAASVNDGDDWIEVELTADTGACDTVMPRAMAQCIPIQPSLQSRSSMMYEAADGNEILNLGKRRCVMWTEGASASRKIHFQVADAHKALLSLSRCADIGFENRFGRRAGVLIDEVTSFRCSGRGIKGNNEKRKPSKQRRGSSRRRSKRNMRRTQQEV